MRKFIDVKGKVILYSNRITFSYNQWCHRLHLGSTQYKQFPQKKKKKRNFKKKKGKGDGNRYKKEVKGKERGGKEEKKKKGMERVCAEGKGKGRMRCGKKR